MPRWTLNIETAPRGSVPLGTGLKRLEKRPGPLGSSPGYLGHHILGLEPAQSHPGTKPHQGRSGFDDRAPSGRYYAGYTAYPPISMSPGDALISTISLTTIGEMVNWLHPSGGSSETPTRTASVLTCLSAPVPTDAFRPSYCDRTQ